MKNKKQDPKLVAAKQKFEIDYISKKYKIPVSVVRKAVSEAGRSRRAVYKNLRAKGYVIGKSNKFKPTIKLRGLTL